MGKKKKKASFKSDSEDDDISTDENSPESSHLSNCPHVGKAVNVATLKKALKAAWIRVGNCGACAKDKRQNIKAAGKNAYVKTVGQQVKNLELASDIWMCLKCGVQSCGPENLKTNSEVGHTICHVKTPRSELHCIFVNVKSWKIYCFECQDDLYIDSYKKLREAVEMVKRVAEVKKVVEPVKKSIMTKSPSTTFNNAEAVKVQKARGLTNLGNTCFFNSVMQCLTQSHPLTKVLDQHCQKGAPFCTPYLELKSTETNHGDNTSLQDSGLSTATSSSLEDTIDEQHANDTIKAFSMQLNEAGPVTLALAAFLKDMHSVGKPGAVNPGHLFGQVCRRSPQFRGFQQQDSHELLRHLMESLRTEEVKRQKSVILKQFGLSEKTDPKTVSQRIKRKLQALGRYSNFTLIDKIFGGQLVSTIVCEQCHNSSQIYEPFLDLSLPLIEEKPQRPGKVKNEDETNEISCFAGFRKNKREETEADGNKQLSKKERQKQKAAARKAKKMAQKQGNVLKLDEVKPEEVKDETKEDEKETKEEIEEKMNEDDEVKEIKLKNSEAKQNINRFEALQNTKNSQQTKRILDGSEEDDEDGFSVDEDDDWEWDYDDGNEAKNTDEKEEELISDYIETDAATLEEEETVPKVSLNPLPPERLKMASEEREKSSEKTTEESAEDEGDIEDNVEEFRLTDPNLLRHLKPFKPDPQRLDPHMEALCRKVRKLSVSMADPDAETETKQYDFDEEKHQTRLQNDWVARSLTSIAPRYHAKSGECSIYSCLAQFTAPELLTGQNKWACDKCTRIQQEMTPESDCSENNSTKMVYSNASKQLLIFCPPAVLTIHLKRFQQTMFNLRKVNKHVTFPMTLDLAPFCSSTSLSMPTVSFSNNEILYTLFGVVEHSGRLQGGHYTAFVKLRPSQLTENLSKFYSCPTARNEEIFNLLAEIEKKNQSQNVEEEPVQSEIPGKWYHISDQSVSEVTEEKVLKCQAYLLFYERIK